MEATVYEKNPVVWLQGSGVSLNIFFARHKEHMRYKKLIAPAFSEAAIREQEPAIQRFIAEFMDGLRVRSGDEMYPDTNGVVDLYAWFNFSIYDVLTKLAFGASVGCLDRGDYHPWVRAVFGAIKHSHFEQAAHRLKPYHRLLERFIPSDVNESYSTHLHFSHRQLEELQRIVEDPSAKIGRAEFTSFMLKGMSKEELEDNVNIIVAAGADTTVTALAAVTYYISHHPDSYKKLTAEIRNTFTRESDITAVAVGQLSYLKAVIKESLRCHPSVPVGLHRVVPKQGGIIDEKWVPGGTWVSVSPYAAYRSSRHWRDPERFIPERWLGEDEAFADDDRDLCTPFSIGPRSCIGIK
ncbi:hypothetical protein ANOM_006283 [Aspergillus nomiae NRRL 13137]|uniref:Cytochrome P450 n=1 Tax=Aspergillus nomiae NRRL (strain ATCC 15546 / NRRL 13137 / CBS 260.88 / M93) TaxID=1509407 RepID=A0A0L1J0N4_ASPN3|nr:uncharacterized protein ANOM_006283 [Aspergillus nomiae NRRL 13137]KNG85329.1 hypothetical protein ANOM_006283 [Aspergillus nomiae NRRL 13137]